MISKAKTNSRADTAANRKFNAAMKSNVTAYLLLIFLGWLGLHRFYVGTIKSASAMLSLFVLSLVFVLLGMGVMGFVILFFWWALDIFFLHGIIEKMNSKIADGLAG